MNIEYVQPENLKPAPWRTTHILRPDLKVLTASLKAGWLAPIVAHEDGYIIDGYARWLIAQDEPSILPIPVVWLCGPEINAMLKHVQLNRGRGQIVAKDLSRLIKRVVRSKKYSTDELRMILNMTVDEFQVLAEGDLLKRKKMKEHKYSQAWVPVETKGEVERIQIERPKTPDK